ncbi:hypothetical protein [Scytonema sp. HK-05]|uniref:hypothetical protein n=1 Tax=Scytonema sp. HK-05 TaxID=1137095 RepID=UPI001300F950|nr:hypothetical protein [Scytonema sp. HK-05]
MDYSASHFVAIQSEPHSGFGLCQNRPKKACLHRRGLGAIAYGGALPIALFATTSSKSLFRADTNKKPRSPTTGLCPSHCLRQHQVNHSLERIQTQKSDRLRRGFAHRTVCDNIK